MVFIVAVGQAFQPDRLLIQTRSAPRAPVRLESLTYLETGAFSSVWETSPVQRGGIFASLGDPRSGWLAAEVVGAMKLQKISAGGVHAWHIGCFNDGSSLTREMSSR
jgi:hypothetical protein